MTAELELSLPGPRGIALKGERVSGQVPTKSRALLCYLAVTGLRHSREKLAGLLWGDKPEASAKANLRKSPYRLRQVVGDALIITRQAVAFDRNSDYWLDVALLEVVWHTVDGTYLAPEFRELDWERVRAAQRRDDDPLDRASICGFRCVAVAPGE